MKPLNIDFVPDRTRLWIWSFTGIAIAIVLTVGLTRIVRLHGENRLAEHRLNQLHEELAALQRPPKVEVNPRDENSRRIAELLQVDLNLVFNTVENLAVPNVRLLSVAVNTTGDAVRLEYQADSMPRVSEISFALNDGYQDRPWVLQSAVAQAGQANSIVANWSASLKALK